MNFMLLIGKLLPVLLNNIYIKQKFCAILIIKKECFKVCPR